MNDDAVSLRFLLQHLCKSRVEDVLTLPDTRYSSWHVNGEAVHETLAV